MCLHCEVCIGSIGTVQVLCKPADVVRVEDLVCLIVRWMDGKGKKRAGISLGRI